MTVFRTDLVFPIWFELATNQRERAQAIRIEAMRLVMILLLFASAGCLKQTVREVQPDDTDEGKSDIRRLEDRLGV